MFVLMRFRHCINAMQFVGSCHVSSGNFKCFVFPVAGSVWWHSILLNSLLVRCKSSCGARLRRTNAVESPHKPLVKRQRYSRWWHFKITHTFLYHTGSSLLYLLRDSSVYKSHQSWKFRKLYDQVQNTGLALCKLYAAETERLSAIMGDDSH